MTFLKIAAAHIVRTYRLTVLSGARIDYGVAISMWPKRGIPVFIHTQDRCFRVSAIGGNICRVVKI